MTSLRPHRARRAPYGWPRASASLILAGVFAPPNPTHHKTSLWRSRTLRTTLARVSFVVISFVSPNLEAQPTPVAAPTKGAATNAADKPAPRQSRAFVSRVAEDLGIVPAKARRHRALRRLRNGARPDLMRSGPDFSRNVGTRGMRTLTGCMALRTLLAWRASRIILTNPGA